MKHVFASIFGLLVLVSVFAWWITPRDAADGRTVLVWVVDDNDIRQQQVRLFERMNPSFDLRVDAGNMDISKVIMQCTQGEGPDLFVAYSPAQLSAYVKAGIAWDLTDELTAMGIDFERDIWNAANPCLLYDGRIYGVPNNVVTEALWINRGLFAAAGVPVPGAGPWTWEEFLAVAQKLTRRNAQGRVEQFGFLFPWYRWPLFIRQWGGQVYSDDGTRCTLDSPECIAAIQFMHDLIYKHQVSPTPEQESAMATQGGWGSGEITWFAGNRAAMALGGRWWLMLLRKCEKLDLGAVECPHGPERVHFGYGKATLINVHSPKRQAALAFLRFMLTREYNEMINHQGDGLGPVKEYSFSDTFLHDPAYPGEDFNGVWRESMRYGVPEQTSLFINGAVADRLIGKQMDLIKSGRKPVAEALHDAAAQVNAEIALTIEREPELRKRYEAIVNRRAEP